MDRYRGFDVNLLCGAGGAEVSGVDASRPLGAQVVAELRRALAVTGPRRRPARRGRSSIA